MLAHGAAGAPEKFTELAAAWADAGYVVAAPRFPLTNEGVPTPVIADLAEQARDVRFVIDGVLAASAGRSARRARRPPSASGCSACRSVRSPSGPR